VTKTKLHAKHHNLKAYTESVCKAPCIPISAIREGGWLPSRTGHIYPSGNDLQ